MYNSRLVIYDRRGFIRLARHQCTELILCFHTICYFSGFRPTWRKATSIFCPRPVSQLFHRKANALKQSLKWKWWTSSFQLFLWSRQLDHDYSYTIDQSFKHYMIVYYQVTERHNISHCDDWVLNYYYYCNMIIRFSAENLTT